MCEEREERGELDWTLVSHVRGERRIRLDISVTCERREEN